MYSRISRSSKNKTLVRSLRVEQLERRELFAVGLDPAFNYGWGKGAVDLGNSSDVAADMVVQPDGKIIVVGSTTAGGSYHNFALARFNADGTLDNTFGGVGLGAGRVATDFDFRNDIADNVLLQDDGKIVVVGTSSQAEQNIAIARYNADGSLDNTFGVLGRVLLDTPNQFDDASISASFIVQDKLVVIGRSFATEAHQGMMWRFNLSDGSPDESFGNSGTLALDVPISIAGATRDGNNYILAGWSTAEDDSAGKVSLARIDANGNLDASFGNNGVVIIGGSWSGGYAQSVLVQPDGKILAAGRARSAGQSKVFILRLLPDGTPDPTFNVDGIYEASGDNRASFEDIALSINGSIVAVGREGSSMVPNTLDFMAVRLKSDGTPDPTFGPGGKVRIDFAGDRDEAKSVFSYANGNLLISGWVAGVTETGYDFGLTRLKSNVQVIPPPGPGGFLGGGVPHASAIRELARTLGSLVFPQPLARLGITLLPVFPPLPEQPAATAHATVPSRGVHENNIDQLLADGYDDWLEEGMMVNW
jgi:uncharacterized delta-60 repeat protein